MTGDEELFNLLGQSQKVRDQQTVDKALSARQAAAKKASQILLGQAEGMDPAMNQRDRLRMAVGELVAADPNFINQFQPEELGQPEKLRSIETVDSKGNPVTRFETESSLAGRSFRKPAKEAKEEPLRSFQIDPIESAIGVKDDIDNFVALGKRLLDQKKAFGPVEGRLAEFQNFLGTGDPDVAQFIANREPITVTLAAAKNQGRPSKEDQKAIDKFLAELKQNPAAALQLLDGALAATQNSIANAFLVQLEAATEGQKNKINAIAKSQGIDLNAEKKLRQLANKEGTNILQVRQDIINGKRDPAGRKLGEPVKFQGQDVNIGQIIELEDDRGTSLKIKITGKDKTGNATYKRVK